MVLRPQVHGELSHMPDFLGMPRSEISFQGDTCPRYIFKCTLFIITDSLCMFPLLQHIFLKDRGRGLTHLYMLGLSIGPGPTSMLSKCFLKNCMKNWRKMKVKRKTMEAPCFQKLVTISALAFESKTKFFLNVNCFSGLVAHVFGGWSRHRSLWIKVNLA